LRSPEKTGEYLMSAYFAKTNETLSNALTQLGGIQTYITTMIVGLVLLNFSIMALRMERKTERYTNSRERT